MKENKSQQAEAVERGGNYSKYVKKSLGAVGEDLSSVAKDFKQILGHAPEDVPPDLYNGMANKIYYLTLLVDDLASRQAEKFALRRYAAVHGSDSEIALKVSKQAKAELREREHEALPAPKPAKPVTKTEKIKALNGGNRGYVVMPPSETKDVKLNSKGKGRKARTGRK